MAENILLIKSENFTSKVIFLSQIFKHRFHEFELADQCFRASSSILANIEEANGAQTLKDFIAKLCIARKELRETRSWLRIAYKMNFITARLLQLLTDESTEIYKILNASIGTSKKTVQQKRIKN